MKTWRVRVRARWRRADEVDSIVVAVLLERASEGVGPWRLDLAILKTKLQ